MAFYMQDDFGDAPDTGNFSPILPQHLVNQMATTSTFQSKDMDRMRSKIDNIEVMMHRLSGQEEPEPEEDVNDLLARLNKIFTQTQQTESSSRRKADF
jgi:hypothetical protein